MSMLLGDPRQIYAPDGVTLLKDYLNGKAQAPIEAMTLAAMFALASPATNRLVLVTDVGVGGSLWRFDGTIWRLTSSVVLQSSAVASAPLTGTTAETIIREVPLLPGLLGLNRSLRLYADWSCSVGASTKSVRIRHSETSGSVVGSSGINFTSSGATTVNMNTQNLWSNVNSAIVQKGSPAALTGNGGVTAGVIGSGNENTVNATYIQFTGIPSDVADIITLERYMVELLA